MKIEFGRLTEIVERGLKLDTADALFFVFSLDGTKEYILFLNRTKQIFEQGLGLDGSLPEYSTFTDDISFGRRFTWNGQSKEKLAGEPFFLVDTGEMFDSFTVTVDKQSVTIDAFTIKEGDDLEDKFGPFVGLREESQDELVKFIAPLIIDWLRNELFG